MFKGIYDAIHHELGELEEKFAGGARINAQELEHIDTMAHALKCLATYEAMAGYSEEPYRRGRTETRYAARETGYTEPAAYARRY